MGEYRTFYLASLFLMWATGLAQSPKSTPPQHSTCLSKNEHGGSFNGRVALGSSNDEVIVPSIELIYT
jgi:hypothetical protein